MPRTVQTARKSTGGVAPRRMLTTRCARKEIPMVPASMFANNFVIPEVESDEFSTSFLNSKLKKELIELFQLQQEVLNDLKPSSEKFTDAALNRKLKKDLVQMIQAQKEELDDIKSKNSD